MDPNTTISGPSSARQRWRADDGPRLNCWLCSFVIFQGIWTRIAKKSYIFVIFRGVGPGPPVPSLDPRMLENSLLIIGDKRIIYFKLNLS